MIKSTWFSGTVIHQPEVIFCCVIPERSWSLRQQWDVRLHGVGWQTDWLRQRCKSTIYIRVTNSSLKVGMHQISYAEILIKKLFFASLSTLYSVVSSRDFKTSMRAASDSDTLSQIQSLWLPYWKTTPARIASMCGTLLSQIHPCHWQQLEGSSQLNWRMSHSILETRPPGRIRNFNFIIHTTITWSRS